VHSRKVLLMSAACVSKYRSFWSFPTNSTWDLFMRQHLKQIAYKYCINFAKTKFSYMNIVHQLTLSLRCNRWKIQNSGDSKDAKIVYAARPMTASGRQSEANDVGLLWRHSSRSRSWLLERTNRRPFLTFWGGIWTPEMLSSIVRTQKALPCVTTRILSHCASKSNNGSLQ